jgi:hypothetical protein
MSHTDVAREETDRMDEVVSGSEIRVSLRGTPDLLSAHDLPPNVSLTRTFGLPAGGPSTT